MSIEERIRFYEEVLEEDPSSKLFFPLARLYYERDEVSRSIKVLRSGLEKHPDHVEARLLLIELLNHEEGGVELELFEHIKRIEKIFKNYPSFWDRWADMLAQNGEGEIAGLVGLLGLKFSSGDADTLGSLIYKGIRGIKGGGPEGKGDEDNDFSEIENVSPSPDQDHDSEERKEVPAVDFKTKTMADILFSQGSYKEALEIYEELYQMEKDENQRRELEECIAKTRNRLMPSGVLNDNKKEKKKRKKRILLSRLSLLARRLERRASISYTPQ